MVDDTFAEQNGPLRPILWRGWRRKCPKCGSGPLMASYLKVRDHCTVCQQELHHHRADDGPAYLTILIVGHIMAPSLHIAFVQFRPEPLVLFTIFAVGSLALSLYLLPRLKGMVVAFQWARAMNGFGAEGKKGHRSDEHSAKNGPPDGDPRRSHSDRAA